MKYKLILAAAVMLWLISAVATAQNYYDDPYAYYRIGGARALSQPATTSSNLSFGGSASLSGFSCGSFSPKLDVRAMLGGIGDTLADLQSLPSQLLTALPGQILCRAQPSLCQLTQHYSVRAEDAWRFSVGSCEDALAAGGIGATDWIRLGKAQEWQRQAVAGETADAARRAVATNDDPCIRWVNGREAGCPGKPPLMPVRDTVEAGWCVANGQSADCTRGGGGTYASEVWVTPQEAGTFVADIVGDAAITDGGSPATHTPVGLQSMVEDESEAVKEILSAVINQNGYATREQAEQLRSPAVDIDIQIINALRNVDSSGIYRNRLAEEIAIARVLNRALLARRLLIKGMNEPNIKSAEPAADAVNEGLTRLTQEIEQLVLEYNLRRSIVADTSIELLQANARARTPSAPPPSQLPGRLPY